MRRREFFSMGAAAAAAPFALAAVEDADGRRRLFLDERVIARSDGLRLELGAVRKEPRNPLFREDKPWEPRYDNLYANVLYDEEDRLYKCWYSPFIVDSKTSETPPERRPLDPYRPARREMGVCYAVSEDGVAWRKPELGLIQFEGSTRNNLVMRRGDNFPEPHGAGVVKNPAAEDPRRRYLAFFRGPGAMTIAYSADGLRWADPEPLPEIDAVGDTHNYLCWAPDLRRWVGITRLWDRERRQRLVGRSESSSLKKWTKAVEILRALPGEPWRQTYAMPIFRHANVYLGLVMLLNLDGDNDTVDCELAWSPDTYTWHRVAPGTPLIPRGPVGSHDSLCLYAAASPVVRPDGILLYYGGNNGKHTGYRDGFFCLARLRPDGYAGLAPRAKGVAGVVETPPLEIRGATLRVSTDAAGGSVRVSLADAPGHSFDECAPLTANVTDAPVRWKSRADIRPLFGRYARLRFEVRDAKLYSFSFA